MAVFMDVTLDDQANGSTEGCEALSDLCPVNIFTISNGKVVVDDGQVDECTLCGLCWERFPEVVRVTKLY